MYGYIYETINLVNGKRYIGQKKSNKFLDDIYIGSGKRLKCAIAYYGRDKFNVKLIEECKTPEELDNREIYWIAKYREEFGEDKIYNIADGGRVNRNMSGKNHPLYGKPHPSKGKKRKPMSAEGRRHISEANKRRFSDPKEREKQSNRLKGRIVPKEVGEKISKALTGKHRPKEVREKISIGNLGKKMSEEFRNKRSEINKGNSFRKGKKCTEEQRKRISEGTKKAMQRPEVRDKLKRNRGD